MTYEYFAPEPNGKGFVLFNAEKCGICGTMIMAPNSIGARETKARLLSIGLKFVEVAPDEDYYDHDNAVSRCYTCYCKAEN